jgi:hypothetical protein
METAFCDVFLAGLKLAVLLPQPPKCWDYSCTKPQAQEKHILFMRFANSSLPTGTIVDPKHLRTSGFEVFTVNSKGSL